MKKIVCLHSSFTPFIKRPEVDETVFMIKTKLSWKRENFFTSKDKLIGALELQIKLINSHEVLDLATIVSLSVLLNIPYFQYILETIEVSLFSSMLRYPNNKHLISSWEKHNDYFKVVKTLTYRSNGKSEHYGSLSRRWCQRKPKSKPLFWYGNLSWARIQFLVVHSKNRLSVLNENHVKTFHSVWKIY